MAEPSSRDRVLQFEQELEQNVAQAAKIEIEVVKLAEMRMSFVDNLTVSGKEVRMASDLAKITRLETSIIALDMILSEFSIKELKGNQELSLIELSSAPLKEGETIEDRNKLAQDAHILNQESACEGILEAISKAQNAEAKLKAMLLEAQTFESQIESSKEESIRNVQLSLEHFNVKLKEYIAQSDVIRKKVTNDYLVLRHNARVAEKILCERRQTAVLAREQMQRNMDLLVKDSSRRRAEVEESLVSEQARLLHEARESVMTKESQVRALAVRTAAKLRDAKKGRAELKGSIKKYEDLYRKLEKRREKEVRSISAELKVFRDMISAVEMKLSIKA